MKLFFSFLTILFTSILGLYYFFIEPKFISVNDRSFSVEFVEKDKNSKVAAIERLQNKAVALRNYALEHEFDTNCVFLIDMTIKSGLKRFFVFDFNKNQFINAGLVAHGQGNSTLSEPQFSNSIGSNSSSIGKYKIATAYQGQFGLAYKLHGLDSSNSNAFKRFVVLHAHDCIPNSEVAPLPICMSQGCPTVSPEFLLKLSPIINKAQRPILLEIFK